MLAKCSIRGAEERDVKHSDSEGELDTQDIRGDAMGLELFFELCIRLEISVATLNAHCCLRVGALRLG